MGHPFKAGVGIAGVCIHQFVDETGYSHICGDLPGAAVHSVNETGPSVTVYETPVRGYADGTSGHSGTETSEARVRRDDASGATAERQALVLRLLVEGRQRIGDERFGGSRGMTVRELRWATEWHHGMASAALTNLHRAGKIARLTEVRDGCKVYVLPEYVGGRETEAYASRSPKPEPLTADERRLTVEALASHPGVEVAMSALAKIKAGAQ